MVGDGHEFERAPGVGDGQGSLACCSPWGCKESDTTERLKNNNNNMGCLGFLTVWCWILRVTIPKGQGQSAWCIYNPASEITWCHCYHVLSVKEVIRICLGSRERDRSLPPLLSGRTLKVTLEEQVEWEILLWSSLQNRTCHTSEVESRPPPCPIWLILWSNILNYLWEMQRGILGHISGTREIPKSTECKLNNYKHSLSISKAHAELLKK